MTLHEKIKSEGFKPVAVLDHKSLICYEDSNALFIDFSHVPDAVPELGVPFTTEKRYVVYEKQGKESSDE